MNYNKVMESHANSDVVIAVVQDHFAVLLVDFPGKNMATAENGTTVRDLSDVSTKKRDNKCIHTTR